MFHKKCLFAILWALGSFGLSIFAHGEEGKNCVNPAGDGVAARQVPPASPPNTERRKPKGPTAHAKKPVQPAQDVAKDAQPPTQTTISDTDGEDDTTGPSGSSR